ncbi:unnamed protein product [Adineta ricciae]|uniref:Uncharacterized protein n=1 Tax=Adineta ricciae TaxID=249248 RepID=A0A815UET1_ADIRI|nr:unnamed protein product [Adineta ricciae]
MGSSNLATILFSNCNKNTVLIACRQSGNAVLDVAAVGNHADVLYICSTITNCLNVVNGVCWYYSDNYSWNFVPGSDNVTRNSYDTIFSTNSNYRMC